MYLPITIGDFQSFLRVYTKDLATKSSDPWNMPSPCNLRYIKVIAALISESYLTKGN